MEFVFFTTKDTKRTKEPELRVLRALRGAYPGRHVCPIVRAFAGVAPATCCRWPKAGRFSFCCFATLATRCQCHPTPPRACHLSESPVIPVKPRYSRESPAIGAKVCYSDALSSCSRKNPTGNAGNNPINRIDNIDFSFNVMTQCAIGSGSIERSNRG